MGCCVSAHATDAEDTPSGYADLVAVCRAVTVPVLARDWQLHPLQARVPSAYAHRGSSRNSSEPSSFAQRTRWLIG